MAKQYKYKIIVLIILSLLATRCASAPDRMAQAPEKEFALTEAISDTTSIQNPAVAQTPLPPQTPIVTNPTNPQPGQVAGGQAMTQSGQPPILAEPEKIAPDKWQLYRNEVYHFTISYPPYYTLKQLDHSELASYAPPPVAAIYFQDQRPELANLAPPQFSIRLWENKAQQAVEDWLVTTKLLNREAGWFTEPYTSTHVSGLKVISPNLMAPGWHVYVAGQGYIFQLTPLGAEAEVMLDTFVLLK